MPIMTKSQRLGNSLVTVFAIHGFATFAKSISFTQILDTTAFGTCFDNPESINMIQ